MSKNAPYIIVAEDDYPQAQRLRTKLSREFSNGRIERIKSESEFDSLIPTFVQDPPDVVVLDVMLRWTVTKPDMPKCPEPVKSDGYHRAGFRCIGELAKSDSTKQIPCIIYTVLERADLDSQFKELPAGARVEYLRKEADHASLFKLIREIIRRKDVQS